MVLVNCPGIIGEKTCKFLNIARKLVWFFFYLPAVLHKEKFEHMQKCGFTTAFLVEIQHHSSAVSCSINRSG